MEKLDEYILFKIAKSLRNDHKSLHNFLLTQKELTLFLMKHESALEELKNQVLIKVEEERGYDGKKIYCTLPNGVKHGKLEKWNYNGGIYKHYNYKNGLKHGECIDLYKSGWPFERAFYERGVLNGKYKRWTKDRSLYEYFFYKNGKKERVRVSGNHLLYH